MSLVSVKDTEWVPFSYESWNGEGYRGRRFLDTCPVRQAKRYQALTRKRQQPPRRRVGKAREK